MSFLANTRQLLNRRWRVLLVTLCVICACLDVSYHYDTGLGLTKFSKWPTLEIPKKNFIARIKNGLKLEQTIELISTASEEDSESAPTLTTSQLPVTSTSTPTTAAYKAVDKGVYRQPSQGLPGMNGALKLPSLPEVKANDKEHFLTYSQRRDYDFIISHNDTCAPTPSIGKNFTPPLDLIKMNDFDFDNELFLLVVIKSMCASESRRRAIRRTWGNETWSKEKHKVRTKVVFLLGACQSREQQEKVIAEDKKSSDILQWDFFDSFRNLTLKDCLYLQWFSTNCRRVPYIFKGDDDVFVNMGNILKNLVELPPESRKNLFVGSLLVNSPRILQSKSKYFVSSNLFPEKYYPPYVSGGGFMMSGDLAFRLFLQSLKTRIIPIDDAFIGILLKSLDVSPQNDNGFKSWGMKKMDPCRLARIKTLHRVLPDEMDQMWKKVTDVDLTKCDKDSDDVLLRQTR